MISNCNCTGGDRIELRQGNPNLSIGTLSRALIVTGALALSGLGSLASAQNCPNLTGHWVSGSGGGLSMDLSESDCEVFSDNLNSASGFHHTVRGQWGDSSRKGILCTLSTWSEPASRLETSPLAGH